MEPAEIDLNKLHTFFAVAEHGGVSAAARRLALTPSAVSQSLSGLEDALDLRLFDRVGRRLVLTREGRLLQQRFREYQRRLGETLTEIVNEEHEARGLVRVGLALGFPRPRLARFLADFADRHPAVTVKALYGSRDALHAGLVEGRLDFAFSFDSSRAASGRIVSRRLLRHALVLVAGKRWQRRSFDLDALRQTPVIDYYQSDPLIHRWIAHHFRRKPPRLHVKVWAATTDLVLELVLGQVGVAVLPRQLVAPYLKPRRLFVVSTGRPELEDSIWLKELRGAHRGPALEAFRSAVLADLARA